MTPHIMSSPLTGRYYIVTRYTRKTAPNGTPYNVAHTKYDCTDQVKQLMAGMVSLEDVLVTVRSTLVAHTGTKLTTFEGGVIEVEIIEALSRLSTKEGQVK